MPALESNMKKLSLTFMQSQYVCELAKSDAPKSVQKKEKKPGRLHKAHLLSRSFFIPWSCHACKVLRVHRHLYMYVD